MERLPQWQAEILPSLMRFQERRAVSQSLLRDRSPSAASWWRQPDQGFRPAKHVRDGRLEEKWGASLSTWRSITRGSGAGQERPVA
jgi:hypothetical protein